MKKILTIALIAEAALLSGCTKEDFLITNDQTMGDIIGGRFLSDQGIWYDIVEQTCDGRLADCKRALVISDILKNTSTKDELSYEIRLKDFIDVSVTEIVSSPGDAPQDPVLVDLAWVSGGYLNLRLGYYGQAASSVSHQFSAAILQKPGINQELVVRVCHNANGEYWGADNVDTSLLEKKSCFVSVPISSFYTDAGSRFPSYYIVEFPWHKMDEDGKTPLAETEIQELKGNLYR